MPIALHLLPEYQWRHDLNWVDPIRAVGRG